VTLEQVIKCREQICGKTCMALRKKLGHKGAGSFAPTDNELKVDANAPIPQLNEFIENVSQGYGGQPVP
jgi:hypothetical protein